MIDAAVTYAKEKGGDIETQSELAMDRLVSEEKLPPKAAPTDFLMGLFCYWHISSWWSSARRFSKSSLGASPRRLTLVSPSTKLALSPRCLFVFSTTLGIMLLMQFL